MKRIAEITGFLVVWGLMITMGIRAGRQHNTCRECKLGHTQAHETLVADTNR